MKADRLYYEEMNFHNLESDSPNILAASIKSDKVCDVQISEDCSLIAIGTENG
jgi:hypothetical protein